MIHSKTYRASPGKITVKNVASSHTTRRAVGLTSSHRARPPQTPAIFASLLRTRAWFMFTP